MTVYIHAVYGRRKIVFAASQAKITCYFIETTHKIHVYVQYVLKQIERDRVITYREEGRREIYIHVIMQTFIMHTLREGGEYANI